MVMRLSSEVRVWVRRSNYCTNMATLEWAGVAVGSATLLVMENAETVEAG